MKVNSLVTCEFGLSHLVKIEEHARVFAHECQFRCELYRKLIFITPFTWLSHSYCYNILNFYYTYHIYTCCITYISFFHYLENDRPTIEELSMFVLSQNDVVVKWGNLENYLRSGHRDDYHSYSYSDLDPIGSCKRVLERWLKGPNATWTHLFKVLERINSEDAAIRIASYLPGTATFTCNIYSSKNTFGVKKARPSKVESYLEVNK